MVKAESHLECNPLSIYKFWKIRVAVWHLQVLGGNLLVKLAQVSES